MIRHLKFCLAALIFTSGGAAALETYECSFQEGRRTAPTPTFIRFRAPDYLERSQPVQLQVVEIPEVRTLPSVALIERNNTKVLSFSWKDSRYESAWTVDKTSVCGSLNFRQHRFSVFVNRHTLKAQARSLRLAAGNDISSTVKGTCRLAQ